MAFSSGRLSSRAERKGRQLCSSSGSGLLAGGRAADRVDDHRAGERYAVVGPGLVAAGGEAVFDEGLVEQHAGEIAGEGPPVRVGALGGRK